MGMRTGFGEERAEGEAVPIGGERKITGRGQPGRAGFRGARPTIKTEPSTPMGLAQSAGEEMNDMPSARMPRQA